MEEQLNNQNDIGIDVTDGVAIDNNQEEILEVDDTDDCLNVESVNDDSSASKIRIEGEDWINTEIVPITKIKCYVPKELYSAIRNIEECVNKKFGSSNEFSIYIHGEFDEEGDLIVSRDYYIPKQKVGGASVDYQEQPEKFYNGCLHKHPSGCTSFSGVDKKYINSNFEFSLLYVNEKINKGIININYYGNRRIQVDLDVITEPPTFEAINIDNIEKAVYRVPTKGFPRTDKSVSTPNLCLPGFSPEVIQPTVVRENLDDEDDDIETDVETIDSFGYGNYFDS